MKGYIYVIVIILLCCWTLNAQSCKRKSSCSCECSDGVLDLKPGATKSSTKYQDVAAADGSLYSYNPCYSFDETDPSLPPQFDNCKSVAACQLVPGAQNQLYDIGTQESASFSYKDGASIDQPNLGNVLTVTYVAADNARTTTVVLQCDTTEDFLPVGEIPNSQPPLYIYVYSTPNACLKPLGLSAGTILIIVLICVIAVYLIGGVLFNKLKKGNSGKDLIPQRELWVSLPGLIKDGVFFVVKRGQYHPIKG
ncbi:uncharacterized protein LOC132546613 [Ylistrum balloti]|uniref:uncharacterized protein LOC132546613 n=1 Tax=Ylistrum balloti TaxID=509963 RepID=UPI002905A807|nr:uncharacterized protein LOC132546613 [Ylistrum balloti]